MRASQPAPDLLTAAEFLAALRRRGARRIRCVRFRNNRSTIWSLTQRGTVLNVHAAFRSAPASILDAFATLAREGGVGSPGSRAAATRVVDWPQLGRAMEEARRRHDEDRAGGRSATHCCATPDQRAYLRAVYAYFNHTRFGGALPADVPVRLSSRMRSALGHMMPGVRADDTRYVVEIALNVDLMLPGNGAERTDTLLHEMAHAADWIQNGNRGHGATWRDWARRVGCRPTTLYDRPVRYRRRRRDRVERVPPLPPALRGRKGRQGQSQPKAPAVRQA